MDPLVRKHLMQKYYPQYAEAAGDDTEIEAAEARRNPALIASGLGALAQASLQPKSGGISHLAGFGEAAPTQAPTRFKTEMADWGGLAEAGNKGVDRAKAEQQKRMAQGMQEDKIASGLQDMEKARAPSAQGKMLLQSSLVSKAKEAEAAGDKSAAQALRDQAANLPDLTAADAMELMNLSKGTDYKDVLNNMNADKRLTRQIDADNSRHERAENLATKKEDLRKQDLETNIRKEVGQNPAFKNAMETDARLSQVDELLKNPNGVSDEAMLVMYQKALDPGSVVREGEFARTAEGQALLQRLDTTIGKYKSGDRMTPELRQNVLSTMKALKDGNKATLSRAMQPYERTINDYALNRDRIFASETQAPPAAAAPKAKAFHGADLPD